MTLLRAYVWNHKVILPNVVQTVDGFFSDESPIQVFEVAKRKEWTNAIFKKLLKGNEIVATPDGSEEPGSAMLDKLNIMKWSTFEVQAVMYTVHLGSRYSSIYKTGRGPDGMWLGSETAQRTFDPKLPTYNLVEELAKDIVRNDLVRLPGTGLSIIQKD